MTYLNRDIRVQKDRTELYRDELFTMTYLNRDIHVQEIEPSFIEMNYSQWHIWHIHVQKIEPSFIEMNYSQWHIWIRHTCPEDRTELYRDELFTMTYLNRDIHVQKIEPSFIEMNYSQWHIWIETYMSRR